MGFPEAEQTEVLKKCQSFCCLRRRHNFISVLLVLCLAAIGILLLMRMPTDRVQFSLHPAISSLLVVATILILARLISRWLIFGRAFSLRRQEMDQALSTPAGQSFIRELDWLDRIGVGCGEFQEIHILASRYPRVA